MTPFHRSLFRNAAAVPAFFLLLFVIGCTTSSSPSSNNNNNSSTTVKPKIQSTFTDSVCYKDTSLAVHPGQRIVYTLIDTNATIAGKSNVYVFTSTIDTFQSPHYDTIYVHYEASGDVSVFVPFAAGSFIVGSEWVTFPFATQTMSNITTFKAVLLDTVTISGTVQGSGTGTQTILGTSLYIEKSTMNANASSALAGTIPATANLSYAPSIGLFTYQDIAEQGSVYGISLSGGSTTFLLSYSLK